MKKNYAKESKDMKTAIRSESHFNLNPVSCTQYSRGSRSLPTIDELPLRDSMLAYESTGMYTYSYFHARAYTR
jgi:hypothetical protein